MTFEFKRDSKRVLLVILGGLLLALSIKIFANAGGLVPGGVSGLAVLIQMLLDNYLSLKVPYTLINIVLNSVPVYIGFRFIGKKFTLLSLLMILASSIFTDIIPGHAITSDPLLISVFGGIIHGVAISCALLGDATSGGTDFIAIFLSERKGMETWNIILAFNAIMLTTSGLFFGWDKAMYSIIFQFISTQVLHLLYRNYQQQTLFIVTDKPQEICDAIYRTCNHGATMIESEGSHSHKEYKMVYSVISGADAKKAIRTVKEIDPDAFINSIRTTELQGNFYLRPKD